MNYIPLQAISFVITFDEVLLDCFEAEWDKMVVVWSQLEGIRKQEIAICYKAFSEHSCRKASEDQQNVGQLRMTFENGSSAAHYKSPIPSL